MIRFLLLTTCVTGAALGGQLATGILEPTGTLLSGDDDYRFAESLARGQELAITNINGAVTVTEGTGRTAVVTVKKVVHRGDGDRVIAIMERTRDGIRVCTVYRDDVAVMPKDCRGRSHQGRRDAPLDVEMIYSVSVPAGVRLDATTVDGDVTVSGLDTAPVINTVDGDVSYRGVMPRTLSLVDGDAELTIRGKVDSPSAINSVDGDVNLWIADDVAIDFHASTIDGELMSDFPATMRSKWGPRSMDGKANGGGTRVELSTVDGSIQVRRAK